MTLTGDPPRTVDNPVPDVEVLFPEARRRRRRRRLGWLGAALCLALVVAVMLFMISFALVNPPSASDHAASERAAPSEFSTGMPLP